MADDVPLAALPVALGAFPKQGQLLPQFQDPRAVQLQAGQGLASVLADASGIPDALRALRGEMTPEEAQNFALTALPGLIPGAKAARPAMEAAEEAAPALMRGIKAFHGSPYDFDRFDISKIGTGEGAQAYGHGLYFAEEPSVAADYRNRLTVGASPQDQTALTYLAKAGGDKAKAKEMARADLGQLPDTHSLIEAIDRHNSGRMYEVSINADPAHFLDWDTKVRDMPPAVQEKLKAAGWNTEGPDQGLLGSQIYQRTPSRRYAIEVNPSDRFNRFGPSDAKTYDEAVAQAGGDKNKVREIHDSSPVGAMNALRDAGIPGIKYLDQGSRRTQFSTSVEFRPEGDQYLVHGPGNIEYGRFNTREEANALATKKNAEGQTHNYVVFDDKLIDIIKKYGWAGLAAALGGSQMPQMPQAQAPSGPPMVTQ